MGIGFKGFNRAKVNAQDNDILFDNGDQKVKVTGGWSTSGYSYANSFTEYPNYISVGSNSINVSTLPTWRSGCTIGTVNMVDLTKYTTLHFVGSFGEVVLNISSVGLAYVAFGGYADGDWVYKGGTFGAVSQKNDSFNHRYTVSQNHISQYSVTKVWLEK